MNDYNFRANNSAIFIFVSPLNRGQLLQERICSSWSKFFLLRVDPFLEPFHHPRIQTGVTKVVSLSKMAEKYVGIPIHLDLNSIVFKIFIYLYTIKHKLLHRDLNKSIVIIKLITSLIINYILKAAIHMDEK